MAILYGRAARVAATNGGSPARAVSEAEAAIFRAELAELQKAAGDAEAGARYARLAIACLEKVHHPSRGPWSH